MHRYIAQQLERIETGQPGMRGIGMRDRVSPPADSQKQSDRRRSGFTIIELLVALSLLATLLLTTIPFLNHFHQQRLQADQRQYAQQLAANVMERLATETSWESLNENLIAGIQDDVTKQQTFLKNPTWNSTLTKSAEPVPSVQVTISLSWGSSTKKQSENNPTTHKQPAPVLLSKWFYQLQEK